MAGDPDVGPTRTKATRQDWIDAALGALENEPIDQLRILNLASVLNVSRSSFYWYFEDPDELRNELLAMWHHNTTAIVDRAERPAPSIVSSCLGVFECWADSRLYHATLDLSIREWGRRDERVSDLVTGADRDRLDALVEMFLRHDFEPTEARVRARLLYHSQVGYYAVKTDESIDERFRLLPAYLVAMTGQEGTKAEIGAFRRHIARRISID
ncbi:MAG: TetR/AcrR family transcriptional regulator [Acidimicrobiales bacterium]